jgi:hypothetical protein
MSYFSVLAVIVSLILLTTFRKEMLTQSHVAINDQAFVFQQQDVANFRNEQWIFSGAESM